VSALWQRLEAPAGDPRTLRRRTNLLVAIHLVLATAAILVLVLVVARIRLLITLAQRSNVETLTIAFVLIFLLYMLVSGAPAAIGSLRILAYRALGRDRAQRALQRKASRDRKETKRCQLNVVVRGPDGGDVELPIEDDFGRLCMVRLHLTEIAFLEGPEEMTFAAMQVIANTLDSVGEIEGTHHSVKIVYWDAIAESESEAYASEVSAFDRLERALDAPEPLWPVVRLDRAGVTRLRDTLREATPTIRESLLLPDVEYSADFTIPVIPEPFAFMQLSRRIEHADAVGSLGCATIVALVFLVVVAWVIVNPPWVPGT